MKYPIVSNEKGFGVIEVMIGVSIVAILLAAIFSVTGNLNNRASIQNAIAQHNALSSGIVGMYSDDPSYTGITNTRVLSSRTAVPDKMRGDDAGILKHHWSVTGDDVTVEASDTGQTFLITYVDIPNDVCNEFTNGVRNGAQTTSVNGNPVLNANDVADFCASNDEDAGDVLVFEYN
tara:strand:+ start:30761 stop:31291 length:531 start_codon:yes stop_codon:yes gene_type:complete